MTKVDLLIVLDVFILMYGIAQATKNSRPIIGILTQEPSVAIKKLYPSTSSYLAASYVKAVEASGARVIPILSGASDSYYRNIIRGLNGIIFPGGNAWLHNKGGYADAGQILFEEAKVMNDGGVTLPILGICLGFELLLFLDNERQEYRASCSVQRKALNLNFKPGFRTSKIYGNLTTELEQIFTHEPVTYNQHIFCVTEKNMTAFNLTNRWKVLSLNNEPGTNLTFVSSIESTKYPFVGIQFHPEKNSNEWRNDLKIPHTKNAIITGRYFFDWLVDEARNNNNSFKDRVDEYNLLISNIPVTFTKGKLTFDELYLFNYAKCFPHFDSETGTFCKSAALNVLSTDMLLFISLLTIFTLKFYSFM